MRSFDSIYYVYPCAGTPLTNEFSLWDLADGPVPDDCFGSEDYAKLVAEAKTASCRFGYTYMVIKISAKVL